MIIGLSGYAQSGKDTVAKYLVENRGFERVAFADPIRNLLWDINPLLKDGFYLQGVVKAYGWDVAKTRFPEVRRLLQELGVGARKNIDEDLWIIKALRTMSGDGNYVVTDVRFQNEASMIRMSGGQIWRVERIGVDAVNSHISEHDLDNWEFDAYIHNNSTIEDLEFAVQTRLRGSK
jgi:dephospho-CoA kinase